MPQGTPRTQVSSAATQGAGVIKDTYDVGDYELFLSCKGAGEPTVVHLHGLGADHWDAFDIRDKLARSSQFCSYDRVNVGRSDWPGGRQLASDSVRDLHTLVTVAGLELPLVLVGASWGGLLATMYAATYPDEVAGMVLLDATLPSLAQIERLMPPADRRQLAVNPEGVDVYASLPHAQRMMRRPPDVPLVYLAARPVELPASWPRKRITALLERDTKEFVAAFPRGRLVEVRSPHVMEPAVPDKIVAEVSRVIAESRLP